MTQVDQAIEHLRQQALELFQVGVEAANPAKGLAEALEASPLPSLEKSRYLIIALGKAAIAMGQCALKAIPSGTAHTALIITNYENVQPVEGATVMAAGHPVPDDNGLKAGEAILDLLATTTDQDRVLVLISGGGSALVPAPIDGLNLADKIAVNKALLAYGYPIEQMNLIRQCLSKLKGGGLAKLAKPASVQSYILSDVVGDDLSVIASGPTSPPLGTPTQALRLLVDKGLLSQVPETVQRALSHQEEEDTPDFSHVQNQLIGSNRKSLDAILAQTPDGWEGHILNDRLVGDVKDVAAQLLDTIQKAPSGKKSLYIWGGETTVSLTGSGRGGRNQELALRITALAEINPPEGTWAFLSGGTDGRDGPTDAAGGIVDANSANRIAQAKGDLAALLENNDSYAALCLSNDLVTIGATGTNVADIQLCLIDKS